MQYSSGKSPKNISMASQLVVDTPAWKLVEVEYELIEQLG